MHMCADISFEEISLRSETIRFSSIKMEIEIDDGLVIIIELYGIVAGMEIFINILYILFNIFLNRLFMSHH